MSRSPTRIADATTTARTTLVLLITVFFEGQTTFLNSILSSLNHFATLLGCFFSEFFSFLSFFSDTSEAVFSLFLAFTVIVSLPFTTKVYKSAMPSTSVNVFSNVEDIFISSLGKYIISLSGYKVSQIFLPL